MDPREELQGELSPDEEHIATVPREWAHTMDNESYWGERPLGHPLRIV